MFSFDPGLPSVGAASPAAAAPSDAPAADAVAFGELFLEAIGVPAGDTPSPGEPRDDAPPADEEAPELLAWIVAPPMLPAGTAKAVPYANADASSYEAVPYANVEAAPGANVEAPPATFDRGVRLSRSLELRRTAVVSAEAGEADQAGTAKAVPYANIQAVPDANIEAAPYASIEAAPYANVAAGPYAGVEVTPAVYERGGSLETNQVETAEAVPHAAIEAVPNAHGDIGAFTPSLSRRVPLQARREIAGEGPSVRLDANVVPDELPSPEIAAAVAAKMLARQVARDTPAEAVSREATALASRVSELTTPRDAEPPSRLDETSRADVDVAPAFNAQLLSRLVTATDGRMDAAISTSSPGSITSATATPTPPADEVIAPQIVRSMRLIAQDGGGEARVRLKPDYLGEVVIVVKVEHGSVTASVQAESPAVRHWAETHEHILRQGLGTHGLRLDELTVQSPAEPSASERQPDERASDQREQPPPRRRPRDEPEPERFEVVL